MDVLRRDTAGEPSHFDMKFVWEILLNPKSWLQAIIFLGYVAPSNHLVMHPFNRSKELLSPCTPLLYFSREHPTPDHSMSLLLP